VGVVRQGTEEIFNFDDYWNEWEFTEDEDLLAKKHAENLQPSVQTLCSS
jgi:hypothetical protein